MPPSTASHIDVIAWYAATTFVIVHAFTAFNTPPTSRSFTTAIRYYAASAFYVLTFLFLFAIVSRSPEVYQFLVNGVPNSTPQPFFAALIVTVLVPSLPPLSTFDTMLRRFLQRVAAIPLQAMRLGEALKDSDLKFSEPDRYAIRNELLRLEFRPTDVVFDREPTCHHVWTRISGLRHFVKRSEVSRGRPTSAPKWFRREIGDIENRYGLLAVKARRLFQRVPRTADAVVDEYVEESLRDFMEAADDLEKQLCEVLSRAALHRNMTESAATDELRALGFDVREGDNKPIVDKLAVLFMGLLAWYVGTITLMPAPMPAHATLGPLQNVVLAAGIAATHCFAVYWALIIKDAGFSRPIRGERRWASYALACMCALATALMTNFALQLFFERRIDLALQVMQTRWPWALMAIATAFMTWFNCDTVGGGRRSQTIAALAQATVTVIFALVVRSFLTRMGVPARDAWQIWIMTGVTGAVIGWFVPAWYRQWLQPHRSAGAPLVVAVASPSSERVAA